jgi:hypothetical protein
MGLVELTMRAVSTVLFRTTASGVMVSVRRARATEIEPMSVKKICR